LYVCANKAFVIDQLSVVEENTYLNYHQCVISGTKKCQWP